MAAIAAATAQAAIVLSPETEQARSGWTAAASRPLTLPMRIAGLSQPSRPAQVTVDLQTHATLSALPVATLITLEGQPKPPVTSHTWNAVARLPGTDARLAGEVIVLSAHIDHVGSRARPGAPEGGDSIFNGADDDASGTVAVLELAEALAKGPRPKRTIVFAWFGSEERGGFGSQHFVGQPPVPLERMIANLQFEMIGRPDPKVPPHTLWLTGYDRSTLGPELAKQGAKLVADPRPDQSFFTRSDNIRFARRGIIAHTVSSFGMHKQYHGVDDEIALIDFAHMTRAINSLVAPIRALANGTFRPSWNPGGCPAPCK
jgi:Zn-dependent M28 family amino/carboxypeptidase